MIVAFQGKAERARKVAEEHAREDWRVLPLQGSEADQGRSRDRGAARARGKFLCFVDPKDLLPPAAIELLVESLARSGSDFAVGRELRLPMTRSVESTPDPAHDAYLQATTLADFPLAIADTGIGNRLYRTGFWRDQGLHFTGVDEGTARPVAVDAFVQARTFDVLPEVTYHRVARGAGVAFGTLDDAMAGLQAWLDEQQVTWRTLDGVDAAAVRDAWAYVVCDAWAIPFVDDVERATPEQWDALGRYLRSVVDLMSDAMWERVRAEAKVKVWLVTQGRRAELEEFLSQRWFELGNRPTEVVDGEVHALLPFKGDAAVGIPDRCFVMSELETRLNAVVQAVRWIGDAEVELDLAAYIDFVDLAQTSPTLEAFAVSASGNRVALPVEPRHDDEATVGAGHRYQDYSSGVCTVRVDLAALVASAGLRRPDAGRPYVEADTLDEWWIELRMLVHGVERSGPLTRRDDRGSAGLLTAPSLAARPVDGCRIQLAADSQVGVRILARPAAPVRLVDIAVHGRRVTGRLTTDLSSVQTVVAKRPDGATVRGRVVDRGDSVAFDLDLSSAPYAEGLNARVWRLVAVDRSRAEHEIEFPSTDPDTLFTATGAGSDLVVGRSATGGCDLVECDRTAVLESFEVDGATWRVRGSWPGRAPKSWRVQLRNKRFQIPATDVSVDGQSFTASGPLSVDEWGIGESPLPVGLFFLDLVAGQSQGSVRQVMSREMVDSLLVAQEGSDHRAVRVCHRREPALRLTAPLAADERGPYAQKQLQEWYRNGDHDLDPQAVYLQSYTGVAATDSQLALHHELRRSRPDLTLYWGVADRSTRVPEGGVPVLMNSREWYRVLATAKYLCNNIDFDRWVQKRPGQKILQTFHGYPAKSMGIRLWAAKRFTPRRIDLELERTSVDWDLILTPTPEMDQYYRTEYRYDGPIEAAGYPRDDVLLSPEADRIRQEARARLGISPEQVVVLYAPTWRDDLATSYRSAPIVRHLDLESATRHLGKEYVFLMRGHRFHAKGDRRSERTARLIDVTDYPEINDLILASDAAVLDYSSLRFDFALTGRPMLFLVPDLADYVGGVRGFLYPFEESAPGPLIEDAEEVVQRLRDLDGVRAEFAEAYEQFNARFNYLQDGEAARRLVKRFFS